MSQCDTMLLLGMSQCDMMLLLQEMSELREECATMRGDRGKLRMELETAQEQQQRHSTTNKQLSLDNSEVRGFYITVFRCIFVFYFILLAFGFAVFV